MQLAFLTFSKFSFFIFICNFFFQPTESEYAAAEITRTTVIWEYESTAILAIKHKYK